MSTDTLQNISITLLAFTLITHSISLIFMALTLRDISRSLFKILNRISKISVGVGEIKKIMDCGPECGSSSSRQGIELSNPEIGVQCNQSSGGKERETL